MAWIACALLREQYIHRDRVVEYLEFLDRQLFIAPIPKYALGTFISGSTSSGVTTTKYRWAFRASSVDFNSSILCKLASFTSCSFLFRVIRNVRSMGGESGGWMRRRESIVGKSVGVGR